MKRSYLDLYTPYTLSIPQPFYQFNVNLQLRFCIYVVVYKSDGPCSVPCDVGFLPEGHGFRCAVDGSWFDVPRCAGSPNPGCCINLDRRRVGGMPRRCWRLRRGRIPAPPGDLRGGRQWLPRDVKAERGTELSRNGRLHVGCWRLVRLLGAVWHRHQVPPSELLLALPRRLHGDAAERKRVTELGYR
eukprot:s1373_g8.t1